MNILDIILLIILFVSIMFGIIKGFSRELFSLAFFIIAVVLSFLFYYEVGSLYSIKSRDVANFAGFITIFVVILIVGSLVTYFTKKVFTFGPLKSIDMIMGGVFGLVRGILIVSIIVFALISFPVSDNLILNSRLSPYVMKSIDVFFGLLPAKFQKKVKLVTGEG
ncbi:MAG: CvpA family protein [bacterium]|nr:CvpA family protein [bacterium]